MKTALGVDPRRWRQRIIDVNCPSFLFKGGKNGLLVFSRHAKPLNDSSSNAQLAPLMIPGWKWSRADHKLGGGRIARACRIRRHSRASQQTFGEHLPPRRQYKRRMIGEAPRRRRIKLSMASREWRGFQ